MRTKVADPTISVYQVRYKRTKLDEFIFGGDLDVIDDDLSDDDVIDYIDVDVDKDFKIEKGDALHIGFDSEYVQCEKTQSNTILSYQYCIIYKDKPPLKGVLYPDKNKRFTLQNFISELIQLALDKRYITQWSGLVYVYAHFLRADLSSFSDFFNYKTTLKGVRSTVTGFADVYGVDSQALGSKLFKSEALKLHDKNRNSKHTVVNFVDTMLLAPNQSGLAAIGELIGLPKLDIPKGYSIERMDLLLAGDKSTFERYAIRDAEIAVFYGLFMQVFVREELGLKHLTATLAGIGLGKYRQIMKASKTNSQPDLKILFGKRDVLTRVWDRKNGKSVECKTTELMPARDLFESLATHCYMGGRNECFVTGVTPVGVWNDFDVASAYTVAMLHLRPLDYNKAYMTTDLSKFTCDVVGIAYVKFKFPEDVRYPSIPVQTPNGLIYPLQGEAYLTSPEIQVALGMGCDIEFVMEQGGVVVPFVEGSEPLFLEFVQMMRAMRKSFDKGSLMELLCKEVSNCLYGKTAQGLKEKSVFDVSTGLSKKLLHSLISNPYYASYISGLVRALVSEQIASIPREYSVLSITTDGYLTNAPLETIDLTLPASKHFTSLFRLIDKTDSILELKHQVKQLAMMKTRGQLTVVAGNEDDDYTKLITAKSGIKPECSKPEHNDWMMRLYLNREPQQTVTNPSIISSRNQWMHGEDLICLSRTLRINLEPDFKRYPCDAITQTFEFNGEQYEHICCQSKPWLNVDDFMTYRAWFDGWRIGHTCKSVEETASSPKSKKKLEDEWSGNCLKTVMDWNNWCDFVLASQYLEKVEKLNLPSNRKTGELLRRLFIRAYVRGEWGLVNSGNYPTHAKFLTEQGYPTTTDDFKNAKKSRVNIIPPPLPATAQVKELFEILQSKFPELCIECVISNEDDFSSTYFI